MTAQKTAAKETMGHAAGQVNVTNLASLLGKKLCCFY